MGMKIGMYNAVKTSIPLKNKDGSSAGTITITKYNKVKKKRIGYNFKRVSAHILAAKTPLFAGKAVREARGAVVTLLMKQMSGDYDSRELDSALEHARKMERIAKKRRKHMEEEERARQTGSCMVEEEVETSEEAKEEEKEKEKVAEENTQKLDEMARELKRLIEESEQALNDLAEELTDASWEDMDPKQLENMKRRHRAQELREIMEADLKYLKALFDRLSKEKQESMNGSSFDGSDSPSGVSLELGGVDMPVETSEAPVSSEGANMDVTV